MTRSLLPRTTWFWLLGPRSWPGRRFIDFRYLTYLTSSQAQNSHINQDKGAIAPVVLQKPSDDLPHSRRRWERSNLFRITFFKLFKGILCQNVECKCLESIDLINEWFQKIFHRIATISIFMYSYQFHTVVLNLPISHPGLDTDWFASIHSWYDTKIDVLRLATDWGRQAAKSYLGAMKTLP